MKTKKAILVPALAAYLMGMVGCASITSSPIPAKVGEIRPGILLGYLPLNKAPDSLALLPAPPAEESIAFAADKEAFLSTRALMHTPRWAQAIKDAHIHAPESPEAFSCALGVPITRDAAPNLHTLMRRTWTDAIVATLAAKQRYNRIRPFAANNAVSCTPNEEADLARDGSYPSGHASVGWTWALILAEIDPAQADAILFRGYAFGQSRVICGVHWQSDVTAGRVMAAAVVAKLHSDPVFRTQLDIAKKEVAAARAEGLKPVTDCKAETTALAF